MRRVVGLRVGGRAVEGKWLLASLKLVRGFWKVSQLEGAEKEVV
jgi:hypothetical protein